MSMESFLLLLLKGARYPEQLHSLHTFRITLFDNGAFYQQRCQSQRGFFYYRINTFSINTIFLSLKMCGVLNFLILRFHCGDSLTQIQLIVIVGFKRRDTVSLTCENRHRCSDHWECQLISPPPVNYTVYLAFYRLPLPSKIKVQQKSKDTGY